MKRMPVIFAAHGSPMNALMSTPFTEALSKLGAQLPTPQAILVVSAHWETEGTKVLYNATPQTIHDFYGFPKALFDVQYPARGPLTLAQATQRLLSESTLSEKWGLDHGTWSVLVHMFPKANIPVFQLSLDVHAPPEKHIELGKHLRNLREQGVLILGSGNIVHNLRSIKWREPNAKYDWAVEFDAGIKNALDHRDEKTLAQYMEKFGSAAELSVPSPEHYWPLLYAFGASDEQDKISYPFEGFEMGSLSMRTVMWSAA
ncbi:4,5-DOPA dioxygenase extradiol [Bdellovibrio sp. HCB209]|uniref:4,5-DOPA-extradiol-dioxygenase n=1 Tax=Bdellovibrio sp. HCB209 TaxID=3394354 RepID=UPI0039B6961B